MNTYKINYKKHEFGYLKFIAKSGSNEICFGYVFVDDKIPLFGNFDLAINIIDK